ncbi:MAG: TlyA family rRNA (cytidine-2'-O)-methyltransferase, partial [Spirochaetia bacterium]|nr:TlyA family rRNA (cytidine-2'-O)-methyltransferase [Spirochaetia bacterium]
MDPAAGKRRLRDVLAVRGYERVDGLILGGFVFVNDERVSSPALYVTTADTIEVRGLKEFVSRSGAKLSGALSEFHISPRGFVCLDLGASTGGFTQVLLQSGAFHVYAVDVGYGIIDYGIRQNAAVTVLDRTDARQVAKEWFSDTHWELIQSSGLFVTCDISFMSIRSVLQPLSLFLKKSHVAMRGVFLLKPQYENSK